MIVQLFRTLYFSNSKFIEIKNELSKILKIKKLSLDKILKNEKISIKRYLSNFNLID